MSSRIDYSYIDKLKDDPSVWKIIFIETNLDMQDISDWMYEHILDPDKAVTLQSNPNGNGNHNEIELYLENTEHKYLFLTWIVFQ